MAAIKCAECGGTVSTSAKTCPHCGARPKQFKRRPLGDKFLPLLPLSIIFVVVVILGKLFPDNDASEMSKVSSSSSVSSQVSQPPSDQAMNQSMNPASVCKASISLIFGQPVSSISTVKNGPVIELSYTRSADNSDWKYRCKLRGDEVIWAGFIDGDWGRWRDHAMDARVTYRVKSDKLTVSEKYPSSEASTKTFNLGSI
jgi:hypothetical protein